MKFVSWAMALGILIFLMNRAIAFHRMTICRQEAWLKGSILITRSLLSQAQSLEKDWHQGCKMGLIRKERTTYWNQLPSTKTHQLQIKLEGML